jgi:hypothetical protein
MLALDDLERAGYKAVVVATPETEGRPVGRQLPLCRFLDDPLAGVDVSSNILVYDLASIRPHDNPASLREAVAALQNFHFVRRSLGAEAATHVAAHARAEWAMTLATVTDWELRPGVAAV